MNIKTAVFSCAAALISFIAYPTGIVDTEGNAATDATDMGDIDMDATTLGDFRAYMVEYIESPETARTTAYTGVSKDTALRDGKFILYHNKTQASGNWTLNLTLADGTTTGAKPVYVWGGTQVSTRYAADSVIPMVYRASANAWFVSDYDSNSNNYDRNLVTYCKAAEAIAANTIVCGTTNGYRKIAANVKFDLGLPILFCNAAQTAGKTNGDNWYSNMTGIDVRTTVSGFVSKRGYPLYLLGSVNGNEFTIASSNFLSYEPVKPCIPLGWFNANADNSFCFLPGPLMVDYATKSDVDAMGATKQDKLPYPTNAIPYAAISGKPTNVSDFNNDAGYVTKSVTNGLLSTATAAATYATKISVSSAAAASTNYTDTATTITEEMGEWVLSASSVTSNGSTYPVYLYHFNPAPQYDYWALGQSVGSGSPFAYVPYNESATSLTFNLSSSFTPSVITATRSKYYVLGSQTDKPIQPAGDYATDNDIAAVRSALAAKLDSTNGVANKLVILTTPFSTLNTEPAVRFSITNGVSTLQVGTYNKTTKTFSVLGGYNLPKGHFGNIVTSTDISGMALLHDLAPECRNTDHKAGELAVHNNVLMICEQDYTGAYDPSYFRAATVEEALAFIRGDLGNVWDRVHSVENDAAAAMREAEKKIDSSNGTAEGLIMLGGLGSETVRQGVMVTNDTIKIGTYNTSSKVFTPQKTFTLPSETGTLVTEGDVSEQLELYLGTNVIHRISANNMSLLWTGPYTGQTGLDILTFVSNNIPHQVTSYYLTWSDSRISASLTCTDGNYSFSAVPDDLSLYSVATTNQLSAATAEIGERIEEVEGMINTPHKYVLSQAPSYYYSGSVSIPAGYYYRAVTGNGYFRYAARIPVPLGKVILSGVASDPIIAYFGNAFSVDSSGMTITSLSSYETDGLYNIADMIFSPDTSLGITASFHCNILNPEAEITAIGFSPASGQITFTDNGIQHTCTISATTSSTCSYIDSAYNLSDGTWTTQAYTISVSFNGEVNTESGYGLFGGEELATKGNPGIVRTLGLRTGLEGEYGSGWGYKAYDFATDRRNWEMKVPGLNVTCSGSSALSYRNFVDQSGTRTQTVWRSYSTPLAMSPNFLFGADLIETADAYGEDGCAQANWRVWMFPGNTNRIDGCALAVLATNRADVGILGAHSSQDGVVPVTLTSVYSGTYYIDYIQRQYTVNHYMSNFRITSVSGSGRTRTITFDYDVFAEARSPSENRSYYTSYTASQTVTLSASLSVDTTITKPSTLIITDKTHHLIYDGGLKCTWELEVENGVFYVRKVSNMDYRKEDIE